MEEAERLCDRVAVINRGRLVAMGRPEELIAAHAGEVHVHFSARQAVPWMKEVPFVHSVHQDDGSVDVLGEGPVLAHVGAALVAHGCEPADLRVERMSLEDVFLRLTGEKREVG
jgi:ABC-2 type transport system ATP-binding protein